MPLGYTLLVLTCGCAAHRLASAASLPAVCPSCAIVVFTSLILREPTIVDVLVISFASIPISITPDRIICASVVLFLLLLLFVCGISLVLFFLLFLLLLLLLLFWTWLRCWRCLL
jgi:hypothetical protein